MYIILFNAFPPPRSKTTAVFCKQLTYELTTYEACDAPREGASLICSSMLHRPLPAAFGGFYLLSAFTPPAFGRRREGGITKF